MRILYLYTHATLINILYISACVCTTSRTVTTGLGCHVSLDDVNGRVSRTVDRDCDVIVT